MLFFDLEILSVGEDVVRVVFGAVKSEQDSQRVIVTVLVDHWNEDQT